MAFVVMGCLAAFQCGYAQRHFAKVRGTMVSSSVSYHRGSKGGGSYRRDVEYSYPCGLSICDSRDMAVSSMAVQTLGASESYDWVAKHPAGSSIDVYVDPNNPRHSALEVEPSSGVVMALTFPMIHAIVGLTLVLGTLGLPSGLIGRLVWRSWLAVGLLGLLVALYAGISMGVLALVYGIYFGLGFGTSWLIKRGKLKGRTLLRSGSTN